MPTEVLQIATITSLQLLRRYNLHAHNIQHEIELNENSPNKYNAIPQAANVDPVLTDPQKILDIGTSVNVVICDITLKGGVYKDVNSGSSITTPAIRLATVLLTVSQAKKIVKTEIQGRDGTVKEYIGMDDYHIGITGVITGSNGHYPKEEAGILKQMLDAPVAIEVISTYLNNLGVHNVVVTDYSFGQVTGGYSMQNFTINCLSDMPLELSFQ
jgi:hypothetical protein